MIIGHFGVAFAAASRSRDTSLGTLFLASQFLDFVCLLLLLAGIETVLVEPGRTVVAPLTFSHYPFSHSLLASVLWATLFAVCFSIIRKTRRDAVWVWLTVLSHWALDAVVHGPDLPLYPGGSVRVGLGLWNYPLTSALLEGLVLLAGLGLYWRTARTEAKSGNVALGSLIGLLGVTHCASYPVLMHWGRMPNPPAINVLILCACLLSQSILIAWAYVADRPRMAALG